MNMIPFRLKYGYWQGDAQDMDHLADIERQQKALRAENKLTKEQWLQQAIERMNMQIRQQRDQLAPVASNPLDMDVLWG